MIHQTPGPIQGPSLETYLETRLNLITKLIETAVEAQKAETQRALLSTDKAIAVALATTGLALSKVELSTEKRFESVNEFRATLADQQRSFIPRAEVDVQIANLLERIASIRTGLDALIVEKRGVQGGWGYAVGLVGFVAAMVSLAVMVMRFGTP